jgi:hypothetical protein
MPYDPGPDFGRLRDEAQRAPSVFNTRPWWFEYRPPDHIDLWLRAMDGAMDKARAREYVISCGAALFNLRLAIRVVGHDLVVWLLPKPNYADPMHPPTLLASVEIVTGRIKKAGTGEQALYEAIEQRHTNRSPYSIVPAPLPIITAMEDAATQEGAYLRLLHRREARRWMRLTAKVDKAFTPPFPNYVSSADYGPPPPKNRNPRTRKDFWHGEKRRFERKPQLMALSTDDDTTVDWLQAGQALQRAILTGIRFSKSERYGLAARYHAPRRDGYPARRHLLKPDDEARHGLSASFLTQPLESDDIAGEARRWPWRWRFAELPQMIIRVGYARNVDQRLHEKRQPEADTSGEWSQPPLEPPQGVLHTLPSPGPGTPPQGALHALPSPWAAPRFPDR